MKTKKKLPGLLTNCNWNFISHNRYLYAYTCKQNPSPNYQPMNIFGEQEYNIASAFGIAK